MAMRTKEKDGKNRQTHYERHRQDDATCCPLALRCDRQARVFERRPAPGHGQNGQPVALHLVPRIRTSRVRGRGFRPSYVTLRVDKRHVGNEAVAAFWKSLDISRILSRVA